MLFICWFSQSAKKTESERVFHIAAITIITLRIYLFKYSQIISSVITINLNTIDSVIFPNEILEFGNFRNFPNQKDRMETNIEI